MATDGTLELRAIKERAGLVLAQDPAAAKFDGLPHSAVDSGVAEIVASANELPERITAYRVLRLHTGHHLLERCSCVAAPTAASSVRTRTSRVR